MDVALAFGRPGARHSRPNCPAASIRRRWLRDVSAPRERRAGARTGRPARAQPHYA